MRHATPTQICNAKPNIILKQRTITLSSVGLSVWFGSIDASSDTTSEFVRLKVCHGIASPFCSSSLLRAPQVTCSTQDSGGVLRHYLSVVTVKFPHLAF